LKNLITEDNFRRRLKPQFLISQFLKMNPQINPKNSPLETLHVVSKKVSCDGSATHPLVYLNMGNKTSVTCPYCSKFFTIEERTGNNSVIIGLKTQMQEEK
jgi:uncharacterized Zn-finger protein